jgi:hypothetical protein
MRDNVARSTSAFVSVLGVAVLGAAAFSAAGVDAQEFPRNAAGKPDFTGVWQALNAAHWNLEDHSAAAGPALAMGAAGAAPPGYGYVEGGTIPYLPAALAQRDENFASRLELDPEIKCYLPGVPRGTYMPQPFQILQSDGDLLVVYQFAGAVRNIYMSDHMEAPVDTWMGWSNGHWDGDTLVVEVASQNGQTWLDRAGNFGSAGMRVTERYAPRGPNHIWYEATIEDPSVYARPWKIAMPLYRRIEPDAQILEFKCEEFVEDLMYGHLSKQAARAEDGSNGTTND